MADLKQGFLVREPLIQAVFDWQKIKKNRDRLKVLSSQS